MILVFLESGFHGVTWCRAGVVAFSTLILVSTTVCGVSATIGDVEIGIADRVAAALVTSSIFDMILHSNKHNVLNIGHTLRSKAIICLLRSFLSASERLLH